MRAALVIIGQEILIGQVVDTNSSWLALQLNRIGVSVGRIVTIPDQGDAIRSTIDGLLNEFDVVLTTGGLGPTSDDITKLILCELFSCPMVAHTPTLEHIKSIFAQRGLPLTDLNRQQADVPEACTPLPNSAGTAPGMWFERGGNILVAMPGVPFEMKAIMQTHVLPQLLNRNGSQAIVHRTIHVVGLPESFLAQLLADWESNLPNSIELAYLPNPTSIRLRLSSYGDNKSSVEQRIEESIGTLLTIIPNNIFGFDDDTMETVIGKLLSQRGCTLSVAESCTGGAIASQLTRVPGATKYFLGGAVAYSNSLKIGVLGVDPELIEGHGAVSQPVVESMAQGALRAFGSHYSIATSGIAGPDGGSQAKPVGTVWIAVASEQGVYSKQFRFGNNRERNIQRSAIVALNMLRLLIIKGNIEGAWA